ncbi:hypothetical protein WK68_16870 [Burkholderia ubonensis]|uniref:hypothetical protein n=1 Tax=Burkholderia ubonensis TaxID=101571 RepID=UPI0007543532|nr:hypothetical protein [Burkholderia ubonensis]KVU37569.1 hypothetical protein WK68_16870 [Burkholderia ubonensis]
MTLSALADMSLDTLCHSCLSPVTLTPGEIFTCASCSKSQIAIEGWQIQPEFKLCPRLRRHAGIMVWNPLNDEQKSLLAGTGVTFLAPPSDFPAFVDAMVFEQHTEPAVCFDGCAWGAGHYHLAGWPEDPSSKFYLIYPVYRMTTQDVLFHGTTPGCANQIKLDGKLLPPGATGQKTQGFVSEKDIRYVGIDKSSADHHDRGALIELEYDGWVLRTHLGLLTQPLHHLHARLPPSVAAIQFHEHGRAIAFRPDALVTPKDSANNRRLWASIAPPPPKEGLLAKFRRFFAR